jgi:hypothetical protein
MASWLAQRWEPSLDGPSRAARQGGSYAAYLPDPLEGRPLALGGTLSARAATVETAVRRLTLRPDSHSLEGLARFLLRSEAIASSRIEGMQVSPQQVALAELAQTEELAKSGFSRNAQLVANNITILRKAATEVAGSPTVTVAGIDELHRALLPDDRHQGLRTVQNWIGGNDWNPVDAQFVPPPPGHVRALMDDLVAYASGGVHAPLIQAALAHAQFETIHPYTDGNGRVGRALIHTILTRRGLTPSAVLPLSLVLLTRSDHYLAGLAAYRYSGRRSRRQHKMRSRSGWRSSWTRPRWPPHRWSASLANWPNCVRNGPRGCQSDERKPASGRHPALTPRSPDWSKSCRRRLSSQRTRFAECWEFQHLPPTRRSRSWPRQASSGERR